MGFTEEPDRQDDLRGLQGREHGKDRAVDARAPPTSLGGGLKGPDVLNSLAWFLVAFAVFNTYMLLGPTQITSGMNEALCPLRMKVVRANAASPSGAGSAAGTASTSVGAPRSAA